MNLTTAKIGLCFGMMLPAVGVGREPVAWLYNGVVLPKLPEWDKSVYPYASIHYMGDTGYYWFWCFTQPLYRGGLGFILVPDGATGIGSVYRPEEQNSWPDFEYDEGDIFHASALWANYDILNEDGTVYLAASEPVPVYD